MYGCPFALNSTRSILAVAIILKRYKTIGHTSCIRNNSNRIHKIEHFNGKLIPPPADFKLSYVQTLEMHLVFNPFILHFNNLKSF